MKATARPRADQTITLADGRALADRPVWHGELDHLVGPAHAHYLSAVLPDATLVLDPEDGQLLPLQHRHEILAAVTAGAETKAPGRDPDRGSSLR